MTNDDLLQIKSALSDLRFIQAAALVASRMNENRDAVAYMRNLHRLTDVIDAKLKEQQA